MRRISAFALAIGFAAVFAACGGSQQPQPDSAVPEQDRGIRIHDAVGKCDLQPGTPPSADSCAAIGCTFSNGKCIPGGGTGGGPVQ